MTRPQFEPLSQPLVDLIDEILTKEDAKDLKDIFLQTAIINEILSVESSNSNNPILNELVQIYNNEPHRLMYHLVNYYYKNTL